MKFYRPCAPFLLAVLITLNHGGCERTKSSGPEWRPDARRNSVVLFFGAEWCEPCHEAEPVLQALRGKVNMIYRFDADADAQAFESYKIEAMPTFIVRRDAREVGRVEGWGGYDHTMSEIRRLAN